MNIPQSWDENMSFAPQYLSEHFYIRVDAMSEDHSRWTGAHRRPQP
jgi:hypothetical protein